MSVNVDECEAAGLDEKEVQKVLNLYEKAGRAADKLKLTVFGGSGSGTLRFSDDLAKRPLIIAAIVNGNIDGGDGAEVPDENGLWRGE